MKMKIGSFLFLVLACIACSMSSVSARLGEESQLLDARDLAEASDDITVTTDDGGGITVSNSDGTLEITGDSVTLTDAETGESLTVEGKVTFDITTGTVIVTGEDANLRFDENGFIYYTDDSFTIGNAEGSITGTGTSITFTSHETGESQTFEGEVTIDEEAGTYVITSSDGTFGLSQDGFVAMNDEGGIAGSFTDDGTATFTDDMLFLENAEGNITITEDSVTFVDAETGESFVVEGEVTYDDEFEAVTVTNANGTFSFNEDGFMAVTDDVIVVGNGVDDGFGVITDDSVTFENADGTVVITETSVTITDKATGESLTYEGEVEFDFDTGTFTVDTEDGMLYFNEDGFLITTDEGFTAGNDEGFITGTFSGDNVVIADENGDCLDIPDIACLNEDFSILCDVLTSTPDVKEFLSSAEYTLFAPPNAAFELISGVLETLDVETLGSILAFHGTEGVVNSSDLECGELLDMSNGYPSRTQCTKNSDGEDIVIQKGGGNRKNDLLPQIIAENIVACNGLIHVVDHVMLPNFIDEFD